MISGKILRDAIISGANNINNQRSRVDELNVFPVPDGDTGTNMGMTVGASVRELEALDDSCTVGEASKTAASAMLRGARGNSGVITSLLFRGFSKALEGKKEATAADIVEALKKGVEGAYKAVMKPTEGTILTVARVASEEAAACGAEDVPALWDVVMAAGQKALEDTPNLLPVLKKAGVVDAGGQGIMVIFEGMGKVFHGEGIVAGGGTAYVNAVAAVNELVGQLEGDEKTGAQIIANALTAPVKQIAANAGLDGSVILDHIKTSGKTGYGFDAYKEVYCDMMESGIVDPTKVTRSALENASSIASVLLTTESLVADKPQPAAAAAPAGEPGMPAGMY